MPSVSIPAAVVAGGSIIGGVAKGIIGGNAAKAAAGAQTQADKYAELLQETGYNQVRSDLAPYDAAGKASLDALTSYTPASQQLLMGEYGAARGLIPGKMTQAELEQTPGYQWALAQGLKATQTSAAARGLGVSGTALKGAATFATGLADNTYQNQFKINQTRFEDARNLLGNLKDITEQGYGQYLNTASLGEKAAVSGADIGQRLLSGAAGAITNQGTATAAGITGQANALGRAIGSITDAPATYLGAQDFFSRTPTTGTPAAPGPNTTIGGFTVPDNRF